MSKAKYPGWRTMTASQRRNARYDRIWEEAKRRDPELFGLSPVTQAAIAAGGEVWKAGKRVDFPIDRE